VAIRRRGPTAMSFREARSLLYVAATLGFADDRAEWSPAGLKAEMLPTRATAVDVYARWRDHFHALVARTPAPLWACRIVAAFDRGPGAARAARALTSRSGCPLDALRG